MNITGLLVRSALSLGAFVVYRAVDTAHTMMSPLISGPMAAQQLGDSNSAYLGTQIVSHAFNGSVASSVILLPLLALALFLIWRGPVRDILNHNHKA